MTSPSSLSRRDSEVETELKIALEEACLEAGVTLSSTHFSPSAGFWLWEEPDAMPAGKVAGWFASARKRSSWAATRQEKRKRSDSLTSQDLSSSIPSSGESTQFDPESGSTTIAEKEDLSQSSLKEKLGKAVELDIFSPKFSWHNLLAVCRTEHMKSAEDEEEKAGAIEVTVNSGGVVYYSLFHHDDSGSSGEAAACIKFAPSRLATQSEQLGLELARHLGVSTPQARVIHKGSSEWSEIIAAVEKIKFKAAAEDNEIGENTCAELLEALNINRSLLLMGYIDGCPLLECQGAFDERGTAERTAATLGRVLVLDLVLRNEDRLQCDQLGWRGNPGNLMATKKPILGSPPSHKDRASKPLLPRGRGGLANRKTHPPPHQQQQWGFRKQLKTQFDSTLGRGSTVAGGQAAEGGADAGGAVAVAAAGGSTPGAVGGISRKEERGKSRILYIVAIDSGVPRRPPSSKAEKDKAHFPQFVELILNDEGVASEILQEISGNKLGHISADGAAAESEVAGSLVKRNNIDQKKVVRAFQEGFRAGARDMQDLRMFLLKLFRKFNQLLKEFITYMAGVEDEKLKDDSPCSNSSGSTSTSAGRRSSVNNSHLSSLMLNDVQNQLEDMTLESRERPGETSTSSSLSGTSSAAAANAARRSVSGSNRTPKTPPSLRQDSPDQSDSSSIKRSFRRSSKEKSGGESWSGKLMESQRSNTPQLSARLTLKLKDVNKSAKVDGELSKELEWWDERIREEGKAICKEQDFTTGFLDHRSSHSLVDSYELKIRIDHLLERMALIVHGVQTERPSCILKFLYIGGALAARSFHTLQHIGITDVLCLCPNELSMEDEYPDSFEFKSFQVRDVEDENISQYFEDASSLIDSVEDRGGAILVHCFEGKSRSAAVVLGYLMLRKGHTLFQAWALLKAAHPRAQPNDGFMKILVQLDKELHGKVSMDWQQKKPEIRMCPVCGRSAGISNSSLRQHLRRAHPDVTQVPMTTKKSPEAHQNENTTAPLENLLSTVGV